MIQTLKKVTPVLNRPCPSEDLKTFWSDFKSQKTEVKKEEEGVKFIKLKKKLEPRPLTEVEDLTASSTFGKQRTSQPPTADQNKLLEKIQKDRFFMSLAANGSDAYLMRKHLLRKRRSRLL